MIADVDIWRTAMVMVKRYGDEALQKAAARAGELFNDGDWQGALTCYRILDAIERLQATKPAEGEPVH